MRSLLWAAAALTVGCAVILAASPSQFMIATAITFGGTAFVLLLSASFLAVGQAEDRERARENAEKSDDV